MIATFHNRFNTLPTTIGTRYNAFMGNASSSWAGAEATQPIGSSYTIKNLYVSLSGAVGGTMVHVLTLRKNGADTGLTITTDAASTTFTDVTHTVSVVAGDTLSWGLVTTGASGAAVFIRIGFEMDGGASGDGAPILTGEVNNTLSASATRYLPIQGGILSTTTGNAGTIIPTAGTINNAYVVLGGTPGAAKSYTATLVKNTVDTALVVTVSGTNTTGNDTTHSVSIAAGDKVYWRIDPTGTPTARMIGIGVRWLPTTDGEYIHTGVSAAPSASATQVASAGNSTFASATQRGGAVPTSTYTLKKLYIDMDSAPASGKSLAFTVLSNGSSTSITTTVADSATSGNDTTHTATSTAGGLVEVQSVPSGTPTVSITRVSWVEYQAVTPPPSGTTSNLMLMGVG